MKPQLAYILRHSNPISYEYAAMAAASCDQVGMPWEYFDGFTPDNLAESEDRWPFELDKIDSWCNGPACCTLNHWTLWKLIQDRNQTAVVLEHDAIMLHAINMPIPDDQIVVLGYKLSQINTYDYVAAGGPKKIELIDQGAGSHAYAISAATAAKLFAEIETGKVGLGNIDNNWFTRDWVRDTVPNLKMTQVPISIMLPTPVICWVRQSTINLGPPLAQQELRPEFAQYLQAGR